MGAGWRSGRSGRAHVSGSFISYAVRDGIATIGVDKPVDPADAIQPARVAEYLMALQDADRDPDVRVILSHSRAASTAAAGLEGAVEVGDALGIPLSVVRDLRVPLVALLDGPVTGPAFVLALAADVRVATTHTHLSVGACPADDGFVSWLRDELGASRARELLLTRRSVPADAAAWIGLVHEVVPADRLLAVGEERAAGLAAADPRHALQVKARFRDRHLAAT
ncbi:enoyl-CoA hydratase/isomerase family protein [Nitriliruptoraceae bacterium ZYF776]|nr:enoyl-CoA hydratase/isomerase family protein [Profundirhabdus halotolerans]